MSSRDSSSKEEPESNDEAYQIIEKIPTPGKSSARKADDSLKSSSS
jgi:hypothetical protein